VWLNEEEYQLRPIHKEYIHLLLDARMRGSLEYYRLIDKPRMQFWDGRDKGRERGRKLILSWRLIFLTQNLKKVSKRKVKWNLLKPKEIVCLTMKWRKEVLDMPGIYFQYASMRLLSLSNEQVQTALDGLAGNLVEFNTKPWTSSSQCTFMFFWIGHCGES